VADEQKPYWRRVGEYLLTDTWPARAAQSLYGAATLPGDVYAGRVDPTSQEAVGRAADLAGAVALGPMGAAAAVPAAARQAPGEMALGSFGGVRALTADRRALERAQHMERQGAPAQDIWSDTGWGRGAEGRWRFEIPDQYARLNENMASDLSAGLPMVTGELLEHPDLYRAYPELARLPVKPQLHGGGTFWGDNIALYPYQEDMRSVLLHELQHGVQGAEQFAAGGSPEGAFSRMLMEPMQKKLNELFRSPTATQAERDALMERMSSAKEQEKTLGYELYKRLMGEVEARNVQTRRDYTDAQRRAYAPSTTEDVLRTKQLVPSWSAPAPGPAAFDKMSPEELGRFLLQGGT